MDANSSGEVMSNMMMAAASAMKGASFASGGSGVLDSTVRIKFSKTILILKLKIFFQPSTKAINSAPWFKIWLLTFPKCNY